MRSYCDTDDIRNVKYKVVFIPTCCSISLLTAEAVKDFFSILSSTIRKKRDLNVPKQNFVYLFKKNTSYFYQDTKKQQSLRDRSYLILSLESSKNAI